MSRINGMAGSWEEEKRHLTDEVEQKAQHITILSTRNKRLHAENDRLRQLLQTHGIEIPDVDTPAKPDQNGMGGPVLTENLGSPAKGTSETKPRPEPAHVTAAKIVAEQAAVLAVASGSKEVPAASAAAQSAAEPVGEDEADLAPKEAAAAIIGAFHNANKTAASTSINIGSSKPVSTTSTASTTSATSKTSTTSTASTASTASTTSTASTASTTSTSAPAPVQNSNGRLDSESSQSSAAPESGDSAKVHVQLLYTTGKDSLAITVMSATNLSALGVLDFSKIVFKSDLVPGRLVSSKSPTVVYSSNLPLNVTMNLAVRQTSFKWKKLQLSLCSVSDGTSETCLGKTQVNLMEFYNNPDPDIVEMWVTIGGDGDDSVFSDKTDKASVTGAGLSGKDTSLRSALGMTRRHTLGGTDMQSSITKAKALALGTPTSTAAMEPPRRLSLTTAPAATDPTAAATTTLATGRESRHSRMSAAVMQAARDEARRKTSGGGGGGGSKPTTDATIPASAAAAVPARATVDADVPDIRALNRSRAGNTSVPRSASVSAGSKPSPSAATSVPSPSAVTSEPAQRTLSDSEKPIAPAAQHSVPAPASQSTVPSPANQPTGPAATATATATARPKLASLGKAASMESLPTERRDSRGSNNSGELKRAIAQNRAAKEVLAALDKGEPEEKADGGEKDEEPEEEESQFVRRASFRLKELRNSQRNKPERLSFRQKQAFFVTANVDIPGTEKKKK